MDFGRRHVQGVNFGLFYLAVAKWPLPHRLAALAGMVKLLSSYCLCFLQGPWWRALDSVSALSEDSFSVRACGLRTDVVYLFLFCLPPLQDESDGEEDGANTAAQAVSLHVQPRACCWNCCNNIYLYFTDGMQSQGEAVRRLRPMRAAQVLSMQRRSAQALVQATGTAEQLGNHIFFRQRGGGRRRPALRCASLSPLRLVRQMRLLRPSLRVC